MPDDTSSLPLWLALLALAEQATRDHLTGLYNRRYFDAALADHMDIAKRYDRPLSLVLFDLDGFKQINDRHGHEAGDAFLRQFADLLKGTARKADIVCRCGGDEFAVILPETGKDAAMKFAARVKAAAAAPTAENAAPAPPRFTTGIAALPCGNLFAEADAHLRAGKNQSR